LKGTLRDLTKAGRIAFEQNELVFLIYFIIIEQFFIVIFSPIINNQDLDSLHALHKKTGRQIPPEHCLHLIFKNTQILFV